VKLYRAEWIVPVDAPPLRDGALVVEGGTIVDVGPYSEIVARRGEAIAARRGEAGFRDLGAVALLPALVNAHTHLELSWMAASPPPRGDFARWMRAMIDRRTPPTEDVSAAVNLLRAQLKETDTTLRLRALWTLRLLGNIHDAELQDLLRDNDEHVRVWAIRLLRWPYQEIEPSQ